MSFPESEQAIGVEEIKRRLAAKETRGAPSPPTHTRPAPTDKEIAELRAFLTLPGFSIGPPNWPNWPPAGKKEPGLPNDTPREYEGLYATVLRRIYDVIEAEETAEVDDLLRTVRFGPGGQGFALADEKKFFATLLPGKVAAVSQWLKSHAGFEVTLLGDGWTLFCHPQDLFGRGLRRRVHAIEGSHGTPKGTLPDDHTLVCLHRELEAVPCLDEPGATFYGWESRRSSVVRILDTPRFEVEVIMGRWKKAQGQVSLWEILKPTNSRKRKTFTLVKKYPEATFSHPHFRQGQPASVEAFNTKKVQASKKELNGARHGKKDDVVNAGQKRRRGESTAATAKNKASKASAFSTAGSSKPPLAPRPRRVESDSEDEPRGSKGHPFRLDSGSEPEAPKRVMRRPRRIQSDSEEVPRGTKDHPVRIDSDSS